MLKKVELNDVIENLDDKLNDVLAQQEFEYLKAYNIYVKRKEKDLRDMIEKLNLKNSNNTLKDEKINMLEKIIQSFRDDQVRIEREREQKNQHLQRLEAKANNFLQEKDFLHK